MGMRRDWVVCCSRINPKKSSSSENQLHLVFQREISLFLEFFNMGDIISLFTKFLLINPIIDDNFFFWFHLHNLCWLKSVVVSFVDMAKAAIGGKKKKKSRYCLPPMTCFHKPNISNSLNFPVGLWKKKTKKKNTSLPSQNTFSNQSTFLDPESRHKCYWIEDNSLVTALCTFFVCIYILRCLHL